MKRYNRPFSHVQNPTAPTNYRLNDLLSRELQKITQKYHDQENEILEMWPEIVGKAFSAVTRAKQYANGILYVTVANSTALSIIRAPQMKKKIIEEYAQRASKFEIREIYFRIGV